MQTARHVVLIIVAIVIVVYLVNQCRKPSGWLGRFFLWEVVIPISQTGHKPGGKLVIIGEAYKRRRLDPTQVAMKLLRAAYLTVSEYRELFSKGGCSEVEIFEERRKGWICAIGNKPSITDSQNHSRV